MKALVLLLPNRKPAEAWKKGLKYAKHYSAELVALFVIEKEDDLSQAQDLQAMLLDQAKQAGITASSEIVVRQEDFDLFTYKNKYDACLLIM